VVYSILPSTSPTTAISRGIEPSVWINRINLSHSENLGLILTHTHRGLTEYKNSTRPQCNKYTPTALRGEGKGRHRRCAEQSSVTGAQCLAPARRWRWCCGDSPWDPDCVYHQAHQMSRGVFFFFFVRPRRSIAGKFNDSLTTRITFVYVPKLRASSRVGVITGSSVGIVVLKDTRHTQYACYGWDWQEKGITQFTWTLHNPHRFPSPNPSTNLRVCTSWY